MTKVVMMATLAVLSLMAGCGNGAGNDYIGKWVRLDSDKSTLQIERNGDAFVFRITEPSVMNGKIETSKKPATLKDGVLQVQHGFLTETFLVDKASGYLMNSRGTEYKRAD